jgi:transcriptional regulator with XRE-family HTH domain
MPTVRQHGLAKALREIRKRLELGSDDVAERMQWSRSKLSRIETAKSRIDVRDLESLLDLYGVTSPERDALMNLASEAGRRGWWTRFGDVFSSAFVGLEDEAKDIRSWQTQLIPGLLQTEDYARAVIALSDNDSERIEARVRARLARQLLLRRQHAPHMHAVLAQSALEQEIGGAEVMRKQLAELWAQTRRPNVTLQVMPYTAGAHLGLDGPFVWLGFVDVTFPDVAYVEGQFGDIFLESEEALARIRLSWEQLIKVALSPEESEGLLLDISRE